MMLVVHCLFVVGLVLNKIQALSILNNQCVLDNTVGRCVTRNLCPQKISSLNNTCKSGTICCNVLAKIVTPTNANPGTNIQFPTATFSLSTTAAPQWVSVSPVTVNPTGGGFPTLSGATPPGIGTSPPSGSLPPNGSSPPNGSAPPSGSLPPNSSAPPSSSTPASGSSAPPPLTGSIMVPPEAPPRNLEPIPTPSDTIVVSAEVTDNSLSLAERKCDIYYSTTSTRQSLIPIVMIIGGIDASENEFPHMAALGFGEPNAKQWLCGGSLISENYVVTAAHCLSVSSIGEVRYVKIGTNDLGKTGPQIQEFNIIRRIPSPQYVTSGFYNDIALLQLDHSAQLTTAVMPICLFSSSDYEDRNLIATGWGRTDSGSPTLQLQKVGLELFPQTECQSAFNTISRSQLPMGIQETTQVCAGSHSQRKDTCQGDSGGPLQIRKDNRWYLVGITSFGIQCGNPNVPGVYTRLSYYVPWIQQVVWNK